MKKKIAILGSTGSIGKVLIDIIKKEKKNFEIILLTSNKNYQKLYNQAVTLNVKNLIITDPKSFRILSQKTKNLDIKVFNNFNNFNNIFTKKIDYVMNSIIGLDGLLPTLKIIKFTKKIAIANKESLICGWNLIKNELKKNKTEFIPVDSEHFSLWYGLQNFKTKSIEKIILTASGGPLYNTPLNKFKNIKVSQALNHPNWKMGKKISIDSATLINKVYEVIEAKNIFDITYNNIEILIHPKSYIHAILKFNNGLIKIIAHDPDMKIPIQNSLYENNNFMFKTKKLNINLLNNLNLKPVDLKKFPVVKLLNKIPKNNSLYETVLITINDLLVDKFLNKKINFIQLNQLIIKFACLKFFDKFKVLKADKIDKIYNLRKYVSLKINSLGI